MVSYRLSTYTCKCCTVFKQSDGLNFDGLAGKNVKISPVKILRYTAYYFNFYTGTYFKLHVVGNGLLLQDWQSCQHKY